MRSLLAFSCAVLAAALPAQDPDPAWAELDARPTPAWFAEAKFGIFIHWGVYSVPSFCDTSTYSEWYQHWLDTGAHDGLERRFHAENYGEDFAYRDFAPMFRAELFDAAAWAEVFQRSGAGYVVLTAKHHDGFCLWPSPVASEVRGHPWHAGDTGPRRDLVGELTEAVRAAGLRMGLYYSFLEWHNPLFDADRAAYVERVMIPQIQDLVTRYRPAILWPDGEWNEPESTWRSVELVRWLRANAANPDELVVNDRWGKGLRGRVGDFYTTEYGAHGGTEAFSGRKPFEECRGIGGSFAFNRAEGYDDYASREDCVWLLVDQVSRGGNLLLDVGPTADGRIPLIMVDRLLAIGRWLERNGASIRGAASSPFRRTPWGRATRDDRRVYLHLDRARWPDDDVLVVTGLVSEVAAARMLGDRRERELPVGRSADGFVHVDLAGLHPDPLVTVIALDLDGPLAIDERIRPGADGVLLLRAADAVVEGRRLRIESAPDPALGRPVANLGYWTEVEDVAAWPAVQVAEGEYAVTAVVAVAPGHAGGRLAVEVGDQRLTATLDAPTAGWQDYREVSLGRVRVAAAGDAGARIVVRPVSLVGGALCNLRQVALRPVR